MLTGIGVLRRAIATVLGNRISQMASRTTPLSTTDIILCMLFGLSRPEPAEGLTTRTELVEVFIHLSPRSSTAGNLTFSFRSPRKRSIFEKIAQL